MSARWLQVFSVVATAADRLPVAPSTVPSGVASERPPVAADEGAVVTAAVDFDVDDEPSPCGHCACWRHEWVVDDEDRRILREWHRADCPVYEAWL